MSDSEPDLSEVDEEVDAEEEEVFYAPFLVHSVTDLYWSGRYGMKVERRGEGDILVVLDKDVRARELCGLLMHRISWVASRLAGEVVPRGEAPWSTRSGEKPKAVELVLKEVGEEEEDALPPNMVRPARVSKTGPGGEARHQLHARLHFDGEAVIDNLMGQWAAAEATVGDQLEAQHRGLLHELQLLIDKMCTTLQKSRPPHDAVTWRRQIGALLSQRGCGIYLQKEAEAMVDFVEALCKYLLEWDDSQGPIEPPRSFHQLHEELDAHAPIIKKILTLLMLLRRGEVQTGSDAITAELRRKKGLLRGRSNRSRFRSDSDDDDMEEEEEATGGPDSSDDEEALAERAAVMLGSAFGTRGSGGGDGGGGGDGSGRDGDGAPRQTRTRTQAKAAARCDLSTSA